MLTIQTTTFETMTIDQKLEKKFPTLFGIPESWADITDYSEFLMSQNVSNKTLRNRRKREKAKARKTTQKQSQPKRKDVWETVSTSNSNSKTKPNPTNPQYIKNKRRKQNRGDTLILKNIPSNTQQKQLEKVFKKYGRIIRINVLTNGIAFIKFAHRNDAVDAMVSIPHFTLKGNKVWVNKV